MTTHAAVRAHLVSQGVIRHRQSLTAKVVAKDAIDTTGDGAHKVATWCYPQATLRDDPAAAGIVGPMVKRAIAGRIVKGPEKILARGFQCAFDDHVFG